MDPSFFFFLNQVKNNVCCFLRSVSVFLVAEFHTPLYKLKNTGVSLELFLVNKTEASHRNMVLSCYPLLSPPLIVISSESFLEKVTGSPWLLRAGFQEQFYHRHFTEI